jgi:hypothetical protein
MGQFDENLREGEGLPRGFNHRLPQGDEGDPIHGGWREKVPPFQIGGFWKYEVCKEVALIEEGIDGDVERDFAFILEDMRNKF